MLICMGSELCCGWMQSSCYTEHGRYGLSWLHVWWNCGVHEQCWVCMVCWSLSYVVNCCWTWQIWIDGRLWSEQCWVTCSFSAMNRLREFCGVHSWQHEWHKMLGWCESVVVSFPSSLVGFLGFHPYMCLFSFRKLLWLVHLVRMKLWTG